MRHFFGNLSMAFTMYSKIPVPRAEWTEENRRYVLGLFPFVGLCIGVITALVGYGLLGSTLPESTVVAVLSVLPGLLSGGIHLDGLIDTLDGLHSYASKERKLEILKDAHVGAFAVIGFGLYLVLWYGVMGGFCELLQGVGNLQMAELKGLFWLPVIMVLSRAYSALVFVTQPDARQDGLKVLFQKDASKRVVLVCSLLWLLLGYGLAAWISIKTCVILIFVGILLAGYVIWMSRRQFGGWTGDLAGFYVQLAELIYFFCVVLLESMR